VSNNSDSQTVAGAVLLLCVIGAVVLLAWHGTLSGAEAFGALTTIITLGGGALAVHSGAKVGARAAGVTEADPADTVATGTKTTTTKTKP
jgi:peptidoglycan/LPS O-acetylase OafA/YrhL